MASASATPVSSAAEEADGPLVTTRVPSNVANATGEDEKGSDNDALESGSGAEEEEFREGGYGWVVVVSVLLVNAHTWGLNSSYAVFLAYYLRTVSFSGSSPLAFAFVGGLSISIALLVSPLATISIRVLGTKTTLRIGVVFETAAFIGASFTTQIWHLLLSQGVAFGIGMGFLFTATVGIVPQWFKRKRGFANALATGGSGFGGLTYSLATNAMISNIGLAWAFRVLAVIAFVVNGVCSMLLRDRNKAVGAVLVAFHTELFKRLEFWLLLIWAFFSLLGYVIAVFSLPDYAQKVGFTATQGSILAACFNLSQGLGRPLIGFVSDKVGMINMAGIGTLIAALTSFFIWIFAGKHYAGSIVYSLFGVFAGCVWPMIAPVGAEVVGLQLLPSALSITWLIMVLPATFSEVIGLSLRKEGPNGYLDVQLFAGFMYTIAFLSIWLLRVWKLREIDSSDLARGQREVCNTSAVPAGTQADEVKPHNTKQNFLWSILRGFWVVQRV